MRISQKDKYRMYGNLASMLQGGTTLAAAADLLRKRSHSRGVRSALDAIAETLADGGSVADAFAQAGLDELDCRTIHASSISGNIHAGLEQLAEYYQSNVEMRSGIIGQLAYPVFILHLGILLLSLPELLTGGGLAAYLSNTIGILVLIYLAGFALWLALRILLDSSRHSIATETLLTAIPVAGPMLADFSRSRFCHLLALQLDSGINWLEALKSSSRSSGSARLMALGRDAAQSISRGSSSTEILQNSKAFPPAFREDIAVASKTGNVETTLQIWASRFRSDAIKMAERLAFWIPKAIYLVILLYLGYRIVSLFHDSMQQMMNVME